MTLCRDGWLSITRVTARHRRSAPQPETSNRKGAFKEVSDGLSTACASISLSGAVRDLFS